MWFYHDFLNLGNFWGNFARQRGKKNSSSLQLLPVDANAGDQFTLNLVILYGRLFVRARIIPSSGCTCTLNEY